MPADTLLLAALRAAPRRYRLPPLPEDAQAARAAGAETALAFAIEAARIGQAPPQLRNLFTEALAALIRRALAPAGGDPAFQALVLRSQDAQVAEYARLAAQAAADQRALRTATDSIAHPGKLRSMAAGPRRNALSQLHRLAHAGAWTELRQAVEQMNLQATREEEAFRSALQAIAGHPGLARLERGGVLLRHDAIRNYLALAGRHGPAAGSAAASVRGRASALLGDQAEDSTVQAFGEIARLLAGGHRVVRSLRTPRGFPGAADKAKEEWDVAIARGDQAADIVLLAEVKTSPAAATPDLARLLRGLRRLAHADEDVSYLFPAADGELRVAGASLRRLRPHAHTLPVHVIYCCSAPPESPAQVLSAASRQVLLAEPASLAFAQAAQGRHEELAPVWEALTTAPRLRAALHQDETARTVREAMLHPQDLLAAVRQQLA